MISNKKWEQVKKNNSDIILGRILRKRFNDLVPVDYEQVEFGPVELVNKDSISELLTPCESMIVIGFPLALEHRVDHDEVGGISAHARFSDYHHDVIKRLEKVANELGVDDYACFADTGPFVDRHLGYLAGLGVLGLNDSLINVQLGSAFAIGIMLTHKTFESDDQPEIGSCMMCNKCVEACPGGALSGQNFKINRCISYLTQKKGELSQEEQRLIKGRLYGCDICQDVCPHNVNVKRISTVDMGISYKELLGLSNKTFKAEYAKSGFAWRGLTTLKRNALYTIKHGSNNDLKQDVKKITFSQKLLQKIQKEV